MTESQQLLERLIPAVPPLREKLLVTVDDWLQEDGRLSMFSVIGGLVQVVVEKFNAGDYSFSDDLFLLVEEVLANGDQESKDVIATGFLEGLQHQKALPADLWVPLLGPHARKYCEAWDKFTGVATKGLGEAS